MEKLLSAKDVAEVLQCKKDKAYAVMREMQHMEEPLRVWESDFMDWIRSKMRGPMAPVPKRTVRTVRKRNVPEAKGKFLIPRERPEI